MGGDDSQKLLPRSGIHSSPGRKPPAHYDNHHSNSNLKSDPRLAISLKMSRAWPSPYEPNSYRPPGSFLESAGG